ncbi:LLM class flavin-dependent oxidoreductase [Gordonia sp. TBRC 11910]|uniref:LLM class flavin-dependent oxidoreductase n=1 Tax=Gordonia asplenii TaxID=2725283 RepID=A0A848KYW1_9ACTN|nr:LLM class flavin-dependent oxidoreductase [Gordonia asplenii]NMO03569.1 LLM class flavin-dependent oxidoreductase [Gordonia asplenii]
MRFILMSEAATNPGTTQHRRYKDMIEEAVFAEEMGFYGWGTSEHHFFNDLCVTPSPECLFTAVAMRTNNLRLRHMSRLTSVIHPILVAEQLATVDLLSDGRVELTTARGNTLLQLDAFGVSLEDTRERSEEALDLIVRALSDDTFSHDGKWWGQIPERRLSPKSLQAPHPPLYKIVQSAESSADARRNGLGMITSDAYLGWEVLEANIAAYLDVDESEVRPVGRYAVKSAASSVMSVRCASTNDKALELAQEDLLRFAGMIINDVYVQLAERSPEQYGEFSRIGQLRKHVDDAEWLRNCGPTILVGDPDYCIEQIQRTQDIGADEMVLRIEGGTHNERMETIENLGRYVFPYFTNPAGVVRSGPVGMLPGDPRQRPSYLKDDAKEEKAS